jgi:hypothetical protein
MHPAWKRLLDLAEPYRRAFERGCVAPRVVQERFLFEALAANANTCIGRRFSFTDITTASAYAERVPIVRFAEVEAELSAWQEGRPTLCAEPAVLTGWSSGSTREAKAIPYSAAGLEGFRNALFPWLSSLCMNDPEIAAGRAYWALSPAGTSGFRNRPAGNDTAYFGEAAPLLVELSAVPLALARLSVVETWRFWTALCLAACEDLSLISVWSPTFLHPLLDTLEQDTNRIADAMRRPEQHLFPPGLASFLRELGHNACRRAERLRAATVGGRLETTVLWPELRRVSCWAHGAAARELPSLAKRLGGVDIEPKGLLSTEAAVSLPIHGARDAVAAVTSSFLELCLDDGRCLPLWAWREGDEGRMLVTTRSGLWRYDTGDRVRITGFWKATPCLVFLGRNGRCVDLCGEKLDETLVQERLPADLDAFQAPDASGRRYCLFLEATQVAHAQAETLAERLDAHLCEILHYRHARELGQLAPVRAIRVAGLMATVAQRARQERGTPLATVKIPALDGDSGWLDYFAHAGVLQKT